MPPVAPTTTNACVMADPRFCDARMDGRDPWPPERTRVAGAPHGARGRRYIAAATLVAMSFAASSFESAPL